MKKILLAVMVLLAGTAVSYSLMPPHVTGSSPDDKGILTGRTIILHGYSLEYADLAEISVTDTTSGKKAPFTQKLTCTWINKCKGPKRDMPGCGQQRCRLDISLRMIVPGHAYEVRFLDYKAKFKASGK